MAIVQSAILETVHAHISVLIAPAFSRIRAHMAPRVLHFSAFILTYDLHQENRVHVHM